MSLPTSTVCAPAVIDNGRDYKEINLSYLFMKKQTYASVWDALEDTAESAANMRMRAQLMIEVEQYVKKSGLSQTAVAKRLGVTQPRLNDLLRGKIDKFSLDALVNMLNTAGRRVSLRVKKAA